jgi:transposase
MFGFSLTSRIYLYSLPTDMRKSFDGLAGLVSNHLHRDPLADGAFVFVNRRRDRMKILVWDRHGFWLLYKRLQGGRFQVPPIEAGASAEALRLEYEQLVMIVEGIDLHSVRRNKRYASQRGY